MSLYADTSALLKLYLDEEGSAAVAGHIGDTFPATCLLTWVEAHAALARREREAREASPAFAAAREALKQDWPALTVVNVTRALADRAATYAETFALRGYDAVQLAAAFEAAQAGNEALTFLSFDRRLNRAALLLGLGVPQGFPQ